MSLRSGPPRPWPPLARDAHKGSVGRALALAGSSTMPGAALLVLRAAQRAGAGLVTLGCLDPELLTALPAGAPEALYLDLCAPGQELPVELAATLAARSDHALLAGPGLGDTARTRALLALLLESGDARPLILDADALNALGEKPERLASCARPLWLTPHPGEAVRLLGRELGGSGAERVAAALELAERSGACVCLKGAGTVIAAGGEHWVNDTGNPGLATAGSGDVLAGVLLAYAAAWGVSGGGDRDLLELAALAVRTHGLAGDLAAAAHGERALVASDVIAYLPAAQRSLEEGGAGC